MNSDKKNFIQSDFIGRNKQILLFLFKLLIAVLLMIFLINYISIDEITKTFNSLNEVYLIPVLFLGALNLSLQIYKWKLVIDAGIGKVKLGDVLRSFFSGLTTGIVTPARLGDHIGRALILKNVKFSNVITVSIIDKLINVIVITFFGSIGVIAFYRLFYRPNFYIDISLLSVLVLLFLFFIYLIFSNGILLQFIKNKVKKIDLLKRNIDTAQKIIGKSFLNKFFLFSVNIFYYLVILLQFSLIVQMLYPGAEILKLMLICSLVLLATTVILPVSFGDLGVRESAASYLVTFIGAAPAVGFNAAILLFIINVIIPSLIGLIFLFRK